VLLNFALTAFATAFTIIDPIGMIPLTLAVTASMPMEKRARVVDQAVIVAAAVMLVMGAIGRPLLAYLGITLPAFLIAGGILLFLIAIDMLFGRPTGAKGTRQEERDAITADNPAVFPLAIPMIAGPGTIATVLLLVNLARGDRLRLFIVVLACAASLFITWLCMRGAARFLHIVTNTGIHVVTRVLGIILAALAVQFVLNGLGQTPLVRRAVAANTTTPAKIVPGADLERTCVQYALSTWAAVNSADGTPSGLELADAPADGRKSAIDRANANWTGADRETPDALDLRFNEAMCLIHHHQAAAAMPVLRELIAHANPSAALRSQTNYRWPMTDSAENVVWLALALAQDQQGQIVAARRSIDTAYFWYPSDPGRAQIARDVRWIDPTSAAKVRVTSPSADEASIASVHGMPCQAQAFIGPLRNTEIWWYCDGQGNEVEAYVFRNGRSVSHFVP